MACLVAIVLCVVPAVAERSPADELKIFKSWLDRERTGYGCDEGPARFGNRTVEAAYPGRHLYYVLTYTRGIPPPFKNPTSVVAEVDSQGKVRSLDPRSLDGYRSGLMRVASARDARRAAAAVLILSMGDPGERRWNFREDLIKARKNRKGWVCTYRHGDARYTSEVLFDRHGLLASIRSSAPPVP